MQTRRQFLRTGAPFAAAAILAPELLGGVSSAAARPLRGGRFADGVISGDPTPTSIELWSRVDGVEDAGTVTVEVATDRAFDRVVARKAVKTSAARNHAVKATVSGLKPHEQYYYRFATATEDSPVGRFRTALPPDSNQPVRLAFFSCADYTHGYYNAYERMAGEDVDFVVCLGDYIYDESYHSTADGTGVRNDPIGSAPPAAYKSGVIRAAHTLDDYRAKYSLYRSDPSLRRMHARFPMVVLWDDHEVQDNYAGGAGALGGLPAAQQYSRKRRAAAYRAFFESMPVTPKGTSRIYRSLTFGKNVELFVMDQRQYRADQPCGDAVAPACADWSQPRPFLGATQMSWLKSALSASKATWKVLANEVMMMPAKVLGDSYYTFDSWQGYPVEREELLQHIVTKGIQDVVFVTGDIHTFIAGDVRTQMGAGATVGPEFVGGSITSQGLGEITLDAGGGNTIKGDDAHPNTPAALIEVLRGINPWIDAADVDHHGYGVLEATSSRLTCELVRMQTIKRKTTATVADALRYHVARGQRSVKGQNGPA